MGSDCTEGVCTAGVCQPATCANGVKDGSETRVDCGGGCSGCSEGQACGAASDCKSLVCKAGVCASGTSADLVRNGTETDTDCGGSSSVDCAIGKRCALSDDCVNGLCARGWCQPAACDNGVKDGTETDLDCGGAGCAACDDGKVCQTGTDCASGVCDAGQCKAPTCSDAVKNGKETDVDCGRACPACADKKACRANSDCAGGLCAGRFCQPTTCNDNLKNNGETDVDCGGSACAPCSAGRTCAANTDCASANCNDGTCAAACVDTTRTCGGSECSDCPPGGRCNAAEDCQSSVCASSLCLAPTCADGIRNGTEVGVDCGGACSPCPNSSPCGLGTDCQSGVCNQTCQAPTCTDAVKNGGESDLDCGASCAPAHLCAAGKVCSGDADCESLVCTGNACQPATCSDGKKNGTESAIDCGGSCTPCPIGSTCNTGLDCQTGSCNQICRAPTCTDKVKNGTETDTDCGATCVPASPCAAGKACSGDADCESLLCVKKVCQPATCSDGKKNGTESAVDCGGSCAPCPNGEPCSRGADCESRSCSQTCQAPTCTDNVKNGTETGLDCGATCGSAHLCPAGQGCAGPADCESLICTGKICGDSSCTDGLKNGKETAVDCGGACNPCADGLPCLVGLDCRSRVCDSTCQAATCSDGAKNGTEVDVDCGTACAGENKLCADFASCSVDTDCEHNYCLRGICSPRGGYALRFDGIDDTALVDRDFTGDYTMEAWIKVVDHVTPPADAGNNWWRSGATPILWDLVSPGDDLAVVLIDGKLSFVDAKAGTPDSILTATSPDFRANPPVWTHIAAVRDMTAGTMSSYVNGVLAGTLATGHTSELLWPGDNILVFAGETSSTVPYTAGIIDELRMWNVVRTRDEIAANMHRRLTGAESGLVGCWHMDEGSGESSADSSPYANTMGLGGGLARKVPGWIVSDAPITEP